jgi:hypothetical protein
VPRSPNEFVTRPAIVISLPAYLPGSRLIFSMLSRGGHPASNTAPIASNTAGKILARIFCTENLPILKPSTPPLSRSNAQQNKHSYSSTTADLNPKNWMQCATVVMARLDFNDSDGAVSSGYRCLFFCSCFARFSACCASSLFPAPA